jgi:CBS domain-containing protein
MDLHLRPCESPAALLSPVVRLGPRTSVIEALATMHRAGARLVVVESDGRSVGIVATTDLMEPLTDEPAGL